LIRPLPLTQLLLLFFIILILASIVPLLYVSFLVLHWMYSKRKSSGTTLLRAWRGGYYRIP
jgi:hypothetical protein